MAGQAGEKTRPESDNASEHAGERKSKRVGVSDCAME